MNLGKLIIGIISGILTTVVLFWGVVEMVWKFRDISDEFNAVRTELATYKNEVERIQETVTLIETKNEELRNSLDVLDEKNAQSISSIDRMESLRNELDTIETRLIRQEREVTKVGTLSTRIESIEETVKNLPVVKELPLAEVRDIQCIPLGERVWLYGEKSYDFCNSDWTLQINEVQKRGIVIGRSFFRVPTVLNNVFKDCDLQIMEISENEKQKRKVDIRGQCGG